MRNKNGGLVEKYEDVELVEEKNGGLVGGKQTGSKEVGLRGGIKLGERKREIYCFLAVIVFLSAR